MKFTEHLSAHITPEWRKQYIQYEVSELKGQPSQISGDLDACLALCHLLNFRTGSGTWLPLGLLPYNETTGREEVLEQIMRQQLGVSQQTSQMGLFCCSAGSSVPPQNRLRVVCVCVPYLADWNAFMGQQDVRLTRRVLVELIFAPVDPGSVLKQLRQLSIMLLLFKHQDTEVLITPSATFDPLVPFGRQRTSCLYFAPTCPQASHGSVCK